MYDLMAYGIMAAAAMAVCFECRVAGLDATETGNEPSLNINLTLQACLCGQPAYIFVFSWIKHGPYKRTPLHYEITGY